MADNIIRLADAPAPETASVPHNIEAEAALLGALMIDNRLAEDVQLKLRPDHFFEPLHGRVYEQILKLVDRNMIASPVTLRPMFEADEEMKELGGPSYLAQLTGSGAAVIGARDFAEQVYELALLRALIGVGREMVENALDTSEQVDPKGQIEAAESALYRVAEEGGSEGTVKTFCLYGAPDDPANDQRLPDEARLHFDSAPVADDVVIAGEPRAHLRAALSTADGNLVVRLQDVASDGTSFVMTTGWLRASHRTGHEHPALLTPGQPYDFDVALWPTHWRVAAGHRLRVSTQW